MDARQLTPLLNRAGINWCPIGTRGGECVAVTRSHWDAVAATYPDDAPQPVRGEHYVYWPEYLFPPGVDPAQWA